MDSQQPDSKYVESKTSDFQNIINSAAAKYFKLFAAVILLLVGLIVVYIIFQTRRDKMYEVSNKKELQALKYKYDSLSSLSLRQEKYSKELQQQVDNATSAAADAKTLFYRTYNQLTDLKKEYEKFSDSYNNIHGDSLHQLFSNRFDH